MLPLQQINESMYKLTINDIEFGSIITTYIKQRIQGAFQTKVATTRNCIVFPAKSVSKLTAKQRSYIECIHILKELTNQFTWTKKGGYGFYGFDLKDVLVIDETIFVIWNAERLLCQAEDTPSLVVDRIIDIPFCGNPELFQLTSLPASMPCNAVYYSLAVLLIYLLLHEYLLVANEVPTLETIEKVLYPIRSTKLYWFLKRCLCLDCNNQSSLVLLI